LVAQNYIVNPPLGCFSERCACMEPFTSAPFAASQHFDFDANLYPERLWLRAPDCDLGRAPLARILPTMALPISSLGMRINILAGVNPTVVPGPCFRLGLISRTPLHS